MNESVSRCKRAWVLKISENVSKDSFGRCIWSQGATCVQRPCEPRGLDLSAWTLRWSSLFSCYPISFPKSASDSSHPVAQDKTLGAILDVFSLSMSQGFGYRALSVPLNISQVHPLLLFDATAGVQVSVFSPLDHSFIDHVLASSVGPSLPIHVT